MNVAGTADVMLTQDLRHAVRGWRKSPVVALTTILTVSLGVAASVAVFSVVHAALVRPLPYPAADRLVELFESSPQVTDPNQTFRVSALNYLTWAERASTFEALAAFQGTGFTITGGGDPERVTGSAVTASMFQVLGVSPIAGRPLRPEDQSPASPRVALIARSLWQRRFGGDPASIGRPIVLDGARHEIVGVVPDTFREIGRSQISAVADPQVFVPLRIDPEQESRGNHVLRVAGRLRAGIPLEQAHAEMTAMASAMAAEFPATNAGWGIRVVPIRDSTLDDGVRPALLMLFGAVLALMAIACANVSHLVLAGAAARQRDLALRSALGASRRRLVRQMLTESLCLAFIGGIAGLWVAFATVDAVRALVSATLPPFAEVRIDGSVFAFGLLVSLGSGVLFGLVPAVRASRVAPLISLERPGRAPVRSPRVRMRQGLVMAQVALTSVLLIVGTLLVQSFVRLQRVPLGFEPAGVLTSRIGLPPTTYLDGASMALFHQHVIDTLAGDSAVDAVAVATSAPFAPGVRRGVVVRRWPAAGGSPGASAVEHIISGGYFRTLQIPVVAGRTFDQRDDARSRRVAIVSQSTARRLWPGSNPIGESFERDAAAYEVIGVVGDVRGASGRGARGGAVEDEPDAAVYFPANQFPQRTMTVLLRAPDGEPAALAARLRSAVNTADPAVALDQLRTLDDWLADTVANPRLTATIAATFAAIALLLAAVGISGVVAYTVGQRTSEIGLRMAIGATKSQVLALVLRGTVTAAAAGGGIGLIAAFLLTGALRALLFDVQPDDPLTFAAAALLLASVSVVAGYLSARRATRADPLAALRAE